MRRRNQFTLPTGFLVVAIPETGLFVKNGKIVTGHGTMMEADEIPLFKRLVDAEQLAKSRAEFWKDGDKNGKHWDFVPIAVLVNERQ
jgi:hypothetical protein